MPFKSLKIIPKDPHQEIPAVDDKVLIGKLKKVFPHADDFEVNKFDRIRFIDQGKHFEAVACTLCKKELEITWWENAMAKANEKGFEELDCECPHCKKTINLNELNYKLPAGFARFSIKILNPKITEGLNPEGIWDFYRLLNCELRQIWCN
jgi:hypothetical protein